MLGWTYSTVHWTKSSVCALGEPQLANVRTLSLKGSLMKAGWYKDSCRRWGRGPGNAASESRRAVLSFETPGT